METNKTTIHYVMAHSKMPEIILKPEKYLEFLQTINQGPVMLSSFLEAIWNNIKSDLEEKTQYEVLDKKQRIDLFSFQISTLAIKRNKKLMIITMPPITEYTETRFITVLLEEDPRYFTCELSKSFNEAKPEDYYILGEWKYNEKKDQFIHEDHGRIENFTLVEYIKKIEKLI
jgi:hypothetical protein